MQEWANLAKGMGNYPVGTVAKYNIHPRFSGIVPGWTFLLGVTNEVLKALDIYFRPI